MDRCSMPSMLSISSSRRDLSIATAIAVAAHALVALVLPIAPIESDARAYHEIARSLASGNGYVFEGTLVTNFAPGYPVCPSRIVIRNYGRQLENYA